VLAFRLVPVGHHLCSLDDEDVALVGPLFDRRDFAVEVVPPVRLVFATVILDRRGSEG
jgi:hypothetical protein